MCLCAVGRRQGLGGALGMARLAGLGRCARNGEACAARCSRLCTALLQAQCFGALSSYRRHTTRDGFNRHGRQMRECERCAASGEERAREQERRDGAN
ncbi:hypothetical protein GUJ93_ZPchr0015g6777 [Zizania palustris]|uniref:Uncharacterized protein n=1 Tax=Zizania palustris TaxID=103762 RepID=A0A8J5T969_ZIZPA|nr:hypothetical protein GUJ93_ZPchr0015g6777 [Zizania palustris]